MPKTERILLWSTAALALILRVLAYSRYRFDSDEQQHLHVVWGWTAGLVQYRDLFDNHTPLFHIVMAPLLAALGERSDILLWMRAPMLLLFAAVVAGTFVVARRLYDVRVALWACAGLVIFPPFFLKSLEFRNDNLWSALWIAVLVLTVGRPPGRGRAFLAGLFLGCAVATSIKTVPLVLAVAIAVAMLRLLRPSSFAPKRLPLLPFAAGLAVVPAVLAGWFVAEGAWKAALYCTFTFNSRLPRDGVAVWLRAASFPLWIAVLAWLCRRFPTADPLRAILALTNGAYIALFIAFWPLVSPRDFLPVMPVLAIFVAARLGSKKNPALWFGTAALLCTTALWYYADRLENRTAWHTTMLDQALRLTRPGERIIDHKGETIYRRRPFYYALETITREQIAHGLIADTIAADVVRTRTYVAQADGPIWPSAGRAFLSANFLDLGRLRAAGQWIGPDGSFTIAIPGHYVILDANGPARGLLDGAPHTGSRALAAGPHRFVSAAPARLAVLWAPAYERGHSPFHLRALPGSTSLQGYVYRPPLTFSTVPVM